MSKVSVRQQLEEAIVTSVEKKKELYIATSHQIHQHPEIGNEEYFASATLTSLLEKEGFVVEKGVAGHDTAFLARKSSRLPGPKIGFLAEYDALPGIGHACGHNIIGTSSVAAAIALSSVLADIGGEVIVLGTPAEEGGPNGSAKGSFVKYGLVQELDVALMAHPSGDNRLTGTTLAVDPLEFEFVGKPAHAAASPEEGINALDAVIQLFNGVNAYRQQTTSDVRIHGIITDGGDAPNIIPEYAKARFFIRAATRETLTAVSEQVQNIAKGAALATGAKLSIIEFQNKVDNIQLNRFLDYVFKDVLESLGETIKVDERAGLGSSDVGNVSQVVPTIHPYIKIGPSSLVAHTEEFKDAAISTAGDRGLILSAKALALTGLRVLTDPSTLKAIKSEFEQRKNER